MLETDSANTNPRLSMSHALGRVQAIYRGHMIAGSEHAVILREAGQEPIVYFPREDVMMEVITPVDFTTENPLLGKASYFTILRDGQFAERGAWTYEQPLPGALDIGGMIAFDPNVVKIEGLVPKPDPMWQREQQQMSDYIRHTDSGSGRSQEEHWKPTVGQHEPDGLPPNRS